MSCGPFYHKQEIKAPLVRRWLPLIARMAYQAIDCLWMTEHKVTRKDRQPGRELQVGLAQQ